MKVQQFFTNFRVKLLPQTQYFKITKYDRVKGTIGHSYEDAQNKDSKTFRFLADYFASRERMDCFIA